MQAIQTKYLGPTNTRSSRIVAKCNAGRLTVPYDHEFDGQGNHEQACKALKEKLGWTVPVGYTDTVCGGLTDGSMVHVFIPKA